MAAPMEVENGGGAGVGGGSAALKRCSSAPLIGPPQCAAAAGVVDVGGAGGAGDAGSAVEEGSAGEEGGGGQQRHPQRRLQLQLQVQPSGAQGGAVGGRTRRFSTSFSPLPQAHSPSSGGPRLTPRVSQLRLEECADASNVREVAHERETHSAMQMSQSWEDLTLMLGGGTFPNGGPASPTRARFSPGVSPSPTRRSYATRRSLSPIAMRPSCLSPVTAGGGGANRGPAVKRRFDLLDEATPESKRPRRSFEPPGSAPESPQDSPPGFTFRPVSPRGPTTLRRPSPLSTTSECPASQGPS